jgi:regulator of nucleoside diphosphate kinase
MSSRSIHVTTQDLQRLRRVISSSARTSALDRRHLAELAAELDRAVIIDDDDIPPDVIRMRTRVRVGDTTSQQTEDYTLVYPWEADVHSNLLSVLAPLGTALLGYREGDHIDWRSPGGVRELRVEKILDQTDIPTRAPCNFAVTSNPSM